MILAGIQKKPPASRRRASSNKLQPIRGKQICRSSSDPPLRAVKRCQIIRSPLKPRAVLHQLPAARGLLNIRIEHGKSRQWRPAPVRNGGEHIVYRFAQYPRLLQRLSCLYWMLVRALHQLARNPRIEISTLSRKGDQVRIAAQQFCWLAARTIIQRIYEIQAGIPGNQFKAARLLFFLYFSSRDSPPLS